MSLELFIKHKPWNCEEWIGTYIFDITNNECNGMLKESRFFSSYTTYQVQFPREVKIMKVLKYFFFILSLSSKKKIVHLLSRKYRDFQSYYYIKLDCLHWWSYANLLQVSWSLKINKLEMKIFSYCEFGISQFYNNAQWTILKLKMNNCYY